MTRRASLALAGGLTLASFVIPVGIYHAVIGRVPTLTPGEAAAALGNSAVLVDVRDAEAFAQRHVEGAVNLPGISPVRDLPESLQGKRLLVIGAGAVDSARAAATLGPRAAAVEDGMQGWIGWLDDPAVRSINPAGRAAGWPVRIATPFEQLSLVVSGYVFKTIYMVLALVIIIALARTRTADTVILGIGMAFFLFGENACAVEYVVYRHGSHLFEYLHSWGMLAGFGFMSWGLMEMADTRMIHYADPTKRCAAILLCRECVKYKPVSCGFRNMLHATILGLIALTVIPLTAAPVLVSYTSDIYGIPVNFSHSVIYQLFEDRWCPVAAAVLLVCAEAALLFARKDPVELARIFVAAALGPLGFGFLRLTFVQVFRDNLLWFDFWEEATELLFVGGIGILLLVFRKAFFPPLNKKESAG